MADRSEIREDAERGLLVSAIANLLEMELSAAEADIRAGLGYVLDHDPDFLLKLADRVVGLVSAGPPTTASHSPHPLKAV